MKKLLTALGLLFASTALAQTTFVGYTPFGVKQNVTLSDTYTQTIVQLGAAPVSGNCPEFSGTLGLLIDSGAPCGTGAGSVTSVGLVAPSIFTVSGSPVTTSGNLTFTFNTETANTFLGGPASGSAVAPTFRLLVGADLPNPSASTLGGIESIVGVSHEWINSISTSGVPSLSQPAFGDISGSLACGQLPALTGNVTSSGCATTIAAGVVTPSMFANAPANTVFGNNTGSAATPGFQTSINVSGTITGSEIKSPLYANTTAGGNVNLGSDTGWSGVSITPESVGSGNGTGITSVLNGTPTTAGDIDLYIHAPNGLTGSTAGGEIDLYSGDALTGSGSAGGYVNIFAGAGDGAGTGGQVAIGGGVGGATGNGGQLIFYGQNGGATSGSGGNLLIEGGYSVGSSGTGGMIELQAGTSAHGANGYTEVWGGLTIGAITGTQPTGGNEGDGTINVSGGYYVNGVLISSGSGTVTSVAQAVPSALLTISGSPITTSGTLTLGLTNATAESLWGNSSGSAGAPSYQTSFTISGSATVGTYTQSPLFSSPTTTITLGDQGGSLDGISVLEQGLTPVTIEPYVPFTPISSFTLGMVIQSLNGLSSGVTSGGALGFTTGSGGAAGGVGGDITSAPGLGGSTSDQDGRVIFTFSATNPHAGYVWIEKEGLVVGTSVTGGNEGNGYVNAQTGYCIQGTCSTSIGSGTVTSVALSVPSFLSVSGSPITTSGTLTVTLSGTALPVANGGTGGTSALAGFDNLSPLTTLGDLLYENATPNAARLAGNTTSTKEFLSQTGTGSVSAAPSWAQVAFSNLSGSVACSQMPALTGAVTSSAGSCATSGGGGSGTVTSFSAGNLSPLFTTSVATSTTTPALTFTLTTQAADTIFGNFTGGTAAPAFTSLNLIPLNAFESGGTGLVLGNGSSGASYLLGSAGTFYYSTGSTVTTLAPNTSTIECMTMTSSVPAWASCGAGGGFTFTGPGVAGSNNSTPGTPGAVGTTGTPLTFTFADSSLIETPALQSTSTGGSIAFGQDGTYDGVTMAFNHTGSPIFTSISAAGPDTNVQLDIESKGNVGVIATNSTTASGTASTLFAACGDMSGSGCPITTTTTGSGLHTALQIGSTSSLAGNSSVYLNSYDVAAGAIATHLWENMEGPQITSGCGTSGSPSVNVSNSTAIWKLTVGSGATTCIINMNAAAANGWFCVGSNVTSSSSIIFVRALPDATNPTTSVDVTTVGGAGGFNSPPASIYYMMCGAL